MQDMQKFDEAITQALERAPHVVIPADFSARVMANLPARSRFVSTVRTHWGRNVSIATAFVLVVLIAWLAVASPSVNNGMLLIESLLIAQLCGLSVWYAVRRYRSS